MDIQWANFLGIDLVFILIFYGIPAFFLLKLAYKSYMGYIISLLGMLVTPAIFILGLSFIAGDNRGGHGFDFPWAELFLMSSSIHFLFFLIVLFFEKKKEHWIKLVISLCIALYAYQSIYVDRYREIWKDKNIVNPTHYMVTQAPKASFYKEEIVFGTHSLNIIDMHMGLGNMPLVLDDNNTLYILESQIIHETTLDNVDRFIFYRGIGLEGCLLIDDTKPKPRVAFYKNNGKKYIYDVNESNKFNGLSIEEFKKIKPYTGTGVTIKNSKKELVLNTGERVELKREIKNALYNRYNKKLFVVYPNTKGIYRYDKNPKNNYNTSQGLVRTILNKASLSKSPIPSQNIFSVVKDKYSTCDTFDTWQKPDIRSLKIHQEQFDTLRKYVMQKPNISYSYKVQMVDNKAIIIVTSSDRKKMRLLFYLSKSDTWYVDRIIIRPTCNKKLVHMYGDVSDMHMDETIPNPKLLSYYTQEFDSAMKDFILAENMYEVFKARVQYGFALKYMEKYGEWYAYLDYRKKRMHEIVQELNATEFLEKNKKRLGTIYTGSSFQIMNSIQDEMLANMNIEEDKYISTIELYKIFRKKYLKEMLKDNQFDSDFLEKQFLKYEPLYLPALKRKYMYQRLMQKKGKQSWKEFIATKIIKLLDTKTSINQKIDFTTTGIHMVSFPIIAATETCNYGLTKRLLEYGTKLDTYTLGESVLFNTINLCDNIDIIRLLVKYGANINETTSVGNFNHRPYLTFLVQKICTKNSQEIIVFLKELYEEGTISHDKYYDDEIIESKLSHCHHDWNSGGGVIALQRGFIYTNDYISKENLKELFDEDKEMLELIDSLENIKIRDMHYNLKKFEEYEMKHRRVRF